MPKLSFTARFARPLLAMLFTMVVVVLFPAAARGAGEPLSCALLADPALGFADSAAFNLLTARLSQDPALALLERTEVNKLLKERSLQLAFDAEGVAARRGLGALLKARVLALLRAGERKVNGKTVRYVDLVACETEHGLRLVQRRLPWDDASPEALAKPVAEAIALAGKRLAEPTVAILAVPPFVSGDLERRFDALQDAYALLIGEALGGAPGLRLVELAEARAVADELRLSGGGGDALRRALLPYYLEGSYRHEVRGAARRVTLTLALKRGVQAAAQKKSAPLAPDAAAGWLRQATQELLAQALHERPIEFHPETEHAELARAARQFEQLGEWNKALALAEAAILIAPADATLRKTAIDLSTRIIGETPAEEEAVRRAVAVNLSAVEHYEHYLRLGGASEKSYEPRESVILTNEIKAFWSAGRKLYEQFQGNPALGPLITELGKAKREAILSRTESAGGYSRGLPYNADDPLEIHVPINEPPAESLAAYLRLINVWVRRSAGRGAGFGPLLVRLQRYDRVDYEAFLARIAELPGRHYALLAQYARLHLDYAGDEDKQLAAREERLGRFAREVARARLDREPEKELLEQIETDRDWINRRIEDRRETERLRKEWAARDAAEAAQHARPRPTPTPAPTPDADADFSLEPIPEVNFAPLGWIEGPGQTDLIWNGAAIYVMRRPGELTPLVTLEAPVPEGYDIFERKGSNRGAGDGAPQGANESFSEVVFDGRWAWAPLKDRILVIDPDSGANDTLGAAQGLPPGEIKVAPLGPGRVCAVGGFGRAWCAVIDYAGDGKAKIDVFHEARLVKGEWTDAGLAFTPRFAATLRGADGRPRVLIGRELPGRAAHLPLMADPERRKVEVIPQRIARSLRGGAITAREGALYWVGNSYDIQASYSYGAGYSVNEASRPRLHVARFAAPEYRDSAEIFGNLPGERIFEYAARPDAGYTSVRFLGGVCYVLSGNAVWLIDQGRGLAFKLRGPMDGDFEARREFIMPRRTGLSHHYGLVAISTPRERSRLTCSIFRPRPDLKGRLAALTAENAGDRTVVKNDPIEGRMGVLRHYADSASDRYTTVTAPIWSHAFVVEKETLPLRGHMTFVAADQTDPQLKSMAMKFNFITSFDAVRGREASSGDDPYFIAILSDTQGNVETLGWTGVIADAEHQPIPNARVRVTCLLRDMSPWRRPWETPPAGGGASASPVSERPIVRQALHEFQTDAAGRLQITDLPGVNVWLVELEVSHPDYGAASRTSGSEIQWNLSRISANNGFSARPAGLTNNGPNSGPAIIALPIVRRGSPEEARAIRGRVLDAQGRPIAGARIFAEADGVFAKRSGMPFVLRMAPLAAVAISDAEGRFSYLPTTEGLRVGSSPRIPATTPYLTYITFPERSELDMIILPLAPGKEHAISAPGPARPHRFTFLGTGNQKLDPAALKLRVTRARGINSPIVAPTPPTLVYDAAAGRPWPEEWRLTPGGYVFKSQTTGERAEAVITSDTPREVSLTMVKPPAVDPKTGRTIYRRTWKGRVLDAATSRPLAGAVVVLTGHKRALNFISADTWKTLHALKTPFDEKSAPGLTMFKTYRDAFFGARTDAEGRFSITYEGATSFDYLAVVAENYLGRCQAINGLTEVNGVITAPPIALGRPAYLTLETRFAGVNPYRGATVCLDFSFADPGQGEFAKAYPGSRTLYTGASDRTICLYDDMIEANRVETAVIPAGVKLRLTLGRGQATIATNEHLPVTIDRVIELKPGETLDLGRITLPKAKDKP